MEHAFITEVVENILKHMGIIPQSMEIIDLNRGDIVRFSVKVEDPFILIGEGGKTLMALNHLVKKIFEQAVIRGKFKEVSFIIDVNGYQEKHIDDLKLKAQMMAERARFFKSSVELIPMNPYERMIVHSFFTNIPDIETESVGMGKDRRVVIKYVEKPV